MNIELLVEHLIERRERPVEHRTGEMSIEFQITRLELQTENKEERKDGVGEERLDTEKMKEKLEVWTGKQNMIMIQIELAEAWSSSVKKN